MATYENIIENVTYSSTLRLTGSEWDNTLVRNVTISNVNGNGVFLRDVDNVTFENVTIRNVTGDGIKLSSSGSTSNVVISSSNISRTGEDGINSGQRYSNGIDHPGLKIVGNTIDQTGLNGGNDGLRHGIYVQSQDFLIENNRVYNSMDGNGISVRSSGIVRNNIVDNSNDSGIAYFADHMGRNGILRIENNTVKNSGYDRDRTDIDLLSVPNQNYVVASIVVGSNDLEQGAAGIQVGNGYGYVDVRIDGTGTYSLLTQQTSTDSNVVRGTSANETIFGRDGDEVFVFEKDGGSDTIVNFDPANDRILVLNFRGVDSVSDLIPRTIEQGDNTIISMGDGDRLILSNTDVSDLSSSDFLFY